MLVALKRPVFIGGQLFTPSPMGTQMPDEFAKQLPKDAEVYVEPPPPPPPAKPTLGPKNPKALKELSLDELPLPPSK